MRFKDIKDKSKEELQLLLKENQEKLRELRFKLSANQLKNVREVRKMKEVVAWVNTLLCSN